MITREQLLEMGLTEEQTTKVLDAHKNELKDNFVPLHRFNEVNDSVNTLKTEIDNRDTQIKDLKKFEGDNEELRTKIKDLEDTNKTAMQQHELKLQTTKKENAVRLELLQNSEHVPHNIDKVFKEFNLDNIVIGEDGKIASGFKEQFDSLLESDGYLFKSAQPPIDPLKNTTGWKPLGNDPQSGGASGNVVDPTIEFARNLAKQY